MHEHGKIALLFIIVKRKISLFLMAASEAINKKLFNHAIVRLGYLNKQLFIMKHITKIICWYENICTKYEVRYIIYIYIIYAPNKYMHINTEKE